MTIVLTSASTPVPIWIAAKATTPSRVNAPPRSGPRRGPAGRRSPVAPRGVADSQHREREGAEGLQQQAVDQQAGRESGDRAGDAAAEQPQRDHHQDGHVGTGAEDLQPEKQATWASAVTSDQDGQADDCRVRIIRCPPRFGQDLDELHVPEVGEGLQVDPLVGLLLLEGRVGDLTDRNARREERT